MQKAKNPTKRIIFQLLSGGVAGGAAMAAFLLFVGEPLMDSGDPGAVLAAIAGVSYVMIGLLVALGAIAPNTGARFLNVEDADELREERPKLAPSAVACVLIGLFLLALAVGPVLNGASEAAALIAAACIAGLVLIGIRMRGSADELARQVSLEASALTLHIGLLVLGAWAVLAQFGYAEWITPLALVSGFAMLQLVAVFAICGVKGMLTPR